MDAMTTPLEKQFRTIRRRFKSARLIPAGDGGIVVEISRLPLPPGWSATETSVSFVVPIGFPQVRPDCFFASADLTLAGGGAPQASGVQQLLGRALRWFSWHLEAWDPERDGLAQYLRFVERRFVDAR